MGDLVLNLDVAVELEEVSLILTAIIANYSIETNSRESQLIFAILQSQFLKICLSSSENH